MADCFFYQEKHFPEGQKKVIVILQVLLIVILAGTQWWLKCFHLSHYPFILAKLKLHK